MQGEGFLLGVPYPQGGLFDDSVGVEKPNGTTDIMTGQPGPHPRNSRPYDQVL